MAEPLDAAIFLEDASEIVQQLYFDKYEEQYPERFGSTTNKLFTPVPKAIKGDGETMQYEVGPADTVRTQIDPLGNIASPQNIDPGTIKVRWNRTDTTAHDFTQISAACQFDIYTMDNGSGGTIVDLADRIYNSIQGDYNEKLAILRHAGRSGQIALVNGAPKQNDRESYTDSAATPTNATGMRILVDTGSIATMKPNARYDFVRPATGVVIAGNVRCTDIPNFEELSAGFEFVSTGPTGGRSTGALGSVADNDIVVFSGTYNQGIYSFGAYFSSPSANESFIAGKDRTDAGNRWMLPQRIRGRETSNAKITKSMFNSAAIAMGFLGEDLENPVVFMSDPTLHQALRDEIGEEALGGIYPIDDSRAARFANFGSIGLNYQHATFGTVKIVADPLARQDRILIINNGTWKTLYYGWKGLRALKEGGSHWYRMNQAAPNTGKGLIYKADWVGNQCDWCTKPWKNGAILNLST